MHLGNPSSGTAGSVRSPLGTCAILGLLSTLLLCVGTSGCASEPQVLPATSHALTPADQVRILQKRPGKYEQLATITLEVTPALTWDENANANAAFELLKQKAAAAGANAVVVWAPTEAYDILATAGYKGTFYQVPIKRQLPTRWVVAQAVYVIKD